MENGEHEEHEDDGGRPVRRWHGAFTWTGLLAVGWVLYELTAQPALGAVAVCLKFGWEDFRTARWLRRRDPDRRRGRACFWLYVANGLWKTAVVAFVMVFAMVTVVAAGVEAQIRGQAQQQQEWVEEVAIGTALTTLAALALAALATLRALWLAWRHGARLWLHSAVHRACWADAWPPHEYAGGRRNRLGCLLLTLALLLVLGVLTGAGEGPYWLLAYLAGPVLLLWAGKYISRNLWARSPWECWGGAVLPARGAVAVGPAEEREAG